MGEDASPAEPRAVIAQLQGRLREKGNKWKVLLGNDNTGKMAEMERRLAEQGEEMNKLRKTNEVRRLSSIKSPLFVDFSLAWQSNYSDSAVWLFK